MLFNVLGIIVITQFASYIPLSSIHLRDCNKNQNNTKLEDTQTMLSN